MRISRIYQPVDLLPGHELEIDERGFQYLAKVLRLKPGDALVLFNGDGHDYRCHITQFEKRSMQVHVDEQEQLNNESPLKIHLGLGISRGERMDYGIQKAVELGVDQITPLITQFCMVKLDQQRQDKRLQHWQGVMISAAEQSGRARIPGLNPVLTLEEWLESLDKTQDRLVLNPYAQTSLKMIQPRSSGMSILIGPEGGLEENEVMLSEQHGFTAVRLGQRILRTETATVSALTALQLLWGDLGI